MSPDSQLYYCFGCHKGGNVIHFVMEMERMEFMDAVKLLAERVHMDLPQREEGPGIREREAARERRERIYAANQAAAGTFTSCCGRRRGRRPWPICTSGGWMTGTYAGLVWDAREATGRG